MASWPNRAQPGLVAVHGAPSLEDRWQVVEQVLRGKVAVARPAVLVVRVDAILECRREAERLERATDRAHLILVHRGFRRELGRVAGDRGVDCGVHRHTEHDDERGEDVLDPVGRRGRVSHDHHERRVERDRVLLGPDLTIELLVLHPPALALQCAGARRTSAKGPQGVSQDHAEEG